MAKLETQEMSNKNDLTNWDEIGEQQGTFSQPLPPATYEFKVPDADVVKDGWTDPVADKNGVKRVSLFIDFLVTNASKRELVNEQRKYMIGGFERNRARKGQPERMVSDLQFFYRDGLKGQEKPTSFVGLCKLIEQEAPGRRFVADVEWRAYCNPKKTRWINLEEEHRIIEDPEGKVGCGASYYQSSLAPFLRDDQGEWSKGNRIACACGANLLVQDGLTKFRGPLGEV